MTSDELCALFRVQANDTAAPFVWSDAELYEFINDAYFMFVRLVGGISDHLSDACMVEASAQDPYSDISPVILRIRQATLLPGNEIVRVINAQDTDSLSEEEWGVLRQINQNTTKGKIRYMVTGLQYGVVRWVHIPDKAYTVQLLIDRLPLEPILGPDQVFEGVQPHHHIHLLKWVRHMAYAKQGDKSADKTKSEAEFAAFQQYCVQARREKDLYKHKVRVVRYGGI